MSLKSVWKKLRNQDDLSEKSTLLKDGHGDNPDHNM